MDENKENESAENKEVQIENEPLEKVEQILENTNNVSEEAEVKEKVRMDERRQEKVIREKKPMQLPVKIPINLKLPSVKKLNLKEFLKSLPHKIIHTLREYRRVIIVSKKPDTEELSKVSKIAGLGMLLIGFIGFILNVIFQLIVGK